MDKMKIIGLIILTVLLSFTSCKKEGCTDIESVDYNEKADIDNGTCTYEANGIVFFNEDVSVFLITWGVNNLDFYVDGVYQTSISSNDFISVFPQCGHANSMSVTKNLGGQQTLHSRFEIRVQSDSALLWEGNLYFKANECYSLLLL